MCCRFRFFACTRSRRVDRAILLSGYRMIYGVHGPMRRSCVGRDYREISRGLDARLGSL